MGLWTLILDYELHDLRYPMVFECIYGLGCTYTRIAYIIFLAYSNSDLDSDSNFNDVIYYYSCINKTSESERNQLVYRVMNKDNGAGSSTRLDSTSSFSGTTINGRSLLSAHLALPSSILSNAHTTSHVALRNSSSSQ